MIPRVEPEGMLFRKPVPTPDHLRGMLFRIMLYRMTKGLATDSAVLIHTLLVCR